MSRLRSRAKAPLGRFGYELRRPDAHSSPEARRARLLDARNIDVVIDVGAFDGTWAENIRRSGYSGRIVSIEPNPEPFRLLSQRAARDEHWDAVQVAVDAKPGTADINIGASPYTSSLLGVRSDRAAFHSWAFDVVASQEVDVDTLDQIAARLGLDEQRGYMKLDVQGLELRALEGAAGLLDQMVAVELELNLVPLYDGQASYDELLAHLAQKSFRLAAVTPGSIDPATGLMVYVDAVLVRPDA